MNNSQVQTEEEEVQVITNLRVQELVKLIEALTTLTTTKEYGFLEEALFTPEAQMIDKKLLLASKEQSIDTAKLYRLQGEHTSQRKHHLKALLAKFKLELTGIKQI